MVTDAGSERIRRTPAHPAPTSTDGRTSEPGLVGPSLTSPVGVRHVQAIQRLAGNRAVQRALTPVVQRDEPARPAVTAAEAEQKMTAELQKSALGQSALAIKAKYRLGLTWTDTGAAGFEETSNSCFVNRLLDPKEAAGYFTHEMHHAEERISGRSPDADKYADDQEDAYVTAMVNEEIAGTVLQFEAMVQMGAGGGLSPTGTDLFPQYKRVRSKAIQDHLANHPGDQSGAEAAAQGPCRQLVNWWVTTSTGPYNRAASKGTSKPMSKIAPSAMDSYENYYVRLFRRSHSQHKPPPGKP